jgi:hypothetical protein
VSVQTHVNLGIDPELLARIDAARGRVPRLVWIRDAIEERLAVPAKAVSAPAKNDGFAGGTKGASPTPATQPVSKTEPPSCDCCSGGMFKARPANPTKCFTCGHSLGAHSPI